MSGDSADEVLVMWLESVWVGRMTYDRAHDLQLATRERVECGAAEPTLLLLEHEPVVTLGRRGEQGDLLVSPEELGARGIELRHAERGGLATYHGPGQLVGYLIAPVRRLAPDLPAFVWAIEEALIRTVTTYGIQAGRHDCARGVWVGEAKLAAIGIAVHRGVSWHGFALNIDPDLSAFALIRPCGLDAPVTSIRALLGSAPTIENVSHTVAAELARATGLDRP